MKQRHLPIVDAYVAGDLERVRTIAAQITPSHPMYKYYSLLSAFTLLNRKENAASEVCAQIPAILDAPPEDPELFVILLRTFVLAAVNSNHVSEAQRCMRLLRNSDERNIRDEIKLYSAATAECGIHLALGDWDKTFETIDAALRQNKIPRGSVTWYRLVIERIRYSLIVGRAPVAESDLKEAMKFPALESSCLTPLAYYRAWLLSECGSYDEALAALDSIPVKTVETIRPAYDQLRVILLIWSGRLDEANELLQLQESAGYGPKYIERGHEAMVRRDLAAARKLFQLAITDGAQNSNPAAIVMVAQDMVDLELADRRTAVARKILTFLDCAERISSFGMLWARLHLLEKNPAQAAAHFKVILDRSGKDHIHHLLRNALELSAADAARLFADASDPEPAAMRPKTPERLPKAEEDHPLVGATPAMRALKAKIAQFAATSGTVLITGETGTGKEVVAQALHQQGSHRREPFLAVNSGAISDTLIESELFGYVKGAFTGATKNQDGLFVAAGRGTIFLDEIEAMSPRMQAALLRVLEEREIRPVGSSKPRPIQARVIVASNQALEEAIAAKTFRSDLYFRISRLHLHIPALRERKEDIPLLAESFLHKAYGERSFRVTDGLARAMKRHAWPGNVRELKNKVELMALLAGDATDLTEEMFTPHAMLAAAAKAPEILSVVPSRPIKAQGMPAAPLAQRTGRYASVRFEKMRALFNEHKKLTRAEIVRLLGCAPGTAANDLRVLEADGVIHRVCTTVSQRTSYFVLRDDKE